MISEEEKRITCSIRAGDAEEFQKFFNRNYQKILTLILFLSKSNSFAEDATQETFLKLWENRERLDENQSLMAFVRRISKNLVIDYFRKDQHVKKYSSEHQKQIEDITPKQENYIIQNLNKKDLEQVLQNALNHLSPNRKHIFLQSRFEEKTYKEIAVEMNTTPKAVERQMAKTITYLKKHISSHYNVTILFYFLIDLIKK